MTAAGPWPSLVARIDAWAGRAVCVRDVIVLVPYSQLLAPARRAFAQRPGWTPRVETTRTLAAALGPPAAVEPGQLSGEATIDRLQAARLLHGQGWARTAWGHDPATMDLAARDLVALAQALWRASAAVVPAQRGEHWARGRARLAVSPADAGRPGLAQRLLACVALEWAATAPAPATDRLYALHPAGWVQIVAAGPDPLAAAVLAAAAGPTLRIDTDRGCAHDSEAGSTGETGLRTDASGDATREHADAHAGDGSSAPTGDPARLRLARCATPEEEAQRSAAQVIDHLGRGETPVALIATDRSVVRRVHALLARHGVSVADETGWRLSTTRCGACLMVLLRAMAPQAMNDDVLDWLKAGAAGAGAAGAGAPADADRSRVVAQLEWNLRRHEWARIADVDPARLPEAAAALWREALAVRASFELPRRRSLPAWLARVQAALRALGDAAWLSADPAGAAVIEHLRLEAEPGRDPAWDAAAAATTLDLASFTRWVGDALDDATYTPLPTDTVPQVVVLPLARAVLRPFAAIVCPGADERRLGRGGPPLPVVDDADAQALGLRTGAQRREDERLAFAQLCRAPRVTLLHRLQEDGQWLAPSPLLQRLIIDARRRGEPVVEAVDVRESVRVTAQPAARPLPAAPGLLPGRWSASDVEALRTCPYRFHARCDLGLRESPELEEQVDRKDFGNWLHAVLLRFHERRPEPPVPQDDLPALHAAADAQRRHMALDEADFLPFQGDFERFAGRYVAWLHERDEAGWRWLAGELALETAPPELDGVVLHGRIDRLDAREAEFVVDSRHGGLASEAASPARLYELLDYKTGNVSALRTRLRQQAAEDTQLPFYALLLAGGTWPGAEDDATRAAYLPLRGSEEVKPIVHPDVARSARSMRAGLADEIARLRAGAPLPALGEGAVCEHCEMRGLCRRDDWAPLDGTGPIPARDGAGPTP